MGTATIVIALLASVLPAAQAAVAPRLVEALHGRGHGTADLVPARVDLYFDSLTSEATLGFLQGSALHIEEFTAAEATIGNPVASGPLYRGSQAVAGDARDLGPFTLDLDGFGADAEIIVLYRWDGNTYAAWVTPTIVSAFTIVPVTTVQQSVDAQDARSPFFSEPALPRLAASLTDLRLDGDLSLLLRNVAFTATSDDASYEHATSGDMRPVDESQAGSSDYTIIEARDASVRTGDVPVYARINTAIFNLHLDGELSARDSLGRDTETLSVGLADVHVTPADEQLAVAVLPRADAAQPLSASAMRMQAPPNMALLWTSVALGIVTLGAGGVAARNHLRIRSQPAPGATGPSPPADAPKQPRTVPELETAYRTDPSDLATALELGLAYAKSARQHDALPLLQMTLRAHPKLDTARYFVGLALLELGRTDEGIRHLQYAFRLNPLNVARFINEGAAAVHGRDARVRAMLAQWSRRFQESNARGYA